MMKIAREPDKELARFVTEFKRFLPPEVVIKPGWGPFDLSNGRWDIYRKGLFSSKRLARITGHGSKLWIYLDDDQFRDIIQEAINRWERAHPEQEEITLEV